MSVWAEAGLCGISRASVQCGSSLVDLVACVDGNLDGAHRLARAHERVEVLITEDPVAAVADAFGHLQPAATGLESAHGIGVNEGGPKPNSANESIHGLPMSFSASISPVVAAIGTSSHRVTVRNKVRPNAQLCQSVQM